MKPFIVEATEFTPQINFDPSNIPFRVSGVSRPENANEFYQPVIEWLKEYQEIAPDKTEVHFMFDYFNTSSLKFFLILLSVFKDIDDSGRKIHIKWFYDEEDDSMLEAGQSLEELSELTFEYIINE